MHPCAVNALPCQIPASFAAGSTVKYRRTFAAYPASAGWELKLWLVGTASVNVTAVADGDGFLVTVPAATTAAITPGPVRWVERVTLAGEVFDAATGSLEVLANLATATNTISHAVRTLAIIEAALENRLTADIESYQIAGRAVSKIPARDLLALRRKYQAEVRLEGADGAGKPIFGSVSVSFGHPQR